MKQAVFGLIVGMALMTQSAFACSCALPRPGLTESEIIRSRSNLATSVFVGTVTTNHKTGFIITNAIKKLLLSGLGTFSKDSLNAEGEFSHIATFRVQTSIKNAASPEVRVTTGHFGGGLCGFMFEVGKSYLVYAYGEPNLETNICSKSKELEYAREEVEVLLR